jgi:hypothetical protein
VMLRTMGASSLRRQNEWQIDLEREPAFAIGLKLFGELSSRTAVETHSSRSDSCLGLQEAIKGIPHLLLFDRIPTDVPISAGSFRYADLLIRPNGEVAI